MALVKVKPTSPGRRYVVKVVEPSLHKGGPHEALVERLQKNGGRNNLGRITVRHQGGGHKQHYRVVDFRRDKIGLPAVVERLEDAPNRSALIALLVYADGEGRTKGCRHPARPWGTPTKGYKTLGNKRTVGMIVRRRK